MHPQIAKTRPQKLPVRSTPASLFVAIVTLLSLNSCAEPRQLVELHFVPIYAGQSIECSTPLRSLSDLRFFVSNVQVHAGEINNEVPLLADDQWQTRDVALVDLEDGSGHCLNGSAAMNAVVRGTVIKGDYDTISFSIGVPFSLNHQDPLRAMSPLNQSAMHWHWRAGYKFLRAGIVTADDAYWVHLGSTGCKGTVTNIERCDAENRVAVTVQITDVQPIIVHLDIESLISGIDLTDGRPNDCSSSPTEDACAPIFANLGLKFGEKTASQHQIVFNLAR